jgi:predicted transcriptional regulator
MDFDNVILLNSRRKKEIAQAVKIKIQTFDNYLQRFIETDIFRRIGRGEYRVNPNLFAKGEWEKVLKRRDEWELTVRYKRDGTKSITARSVPADIENQVIPVKDDINRTKLMGDAALSNQHYPNSLKLQEQNGKNDYHYDF